MADPGNELDGPETDGTMAPSAEDDQSGDAIIRASWVGTGVYVLTAVAALVAVRVFVIPLIAVSCLLLVIGMLAFAAAYVIAISRSREVNIGMGGLYFLAGTAPKRVQWLLLGSFVTEILVATVTASIGVATLPEDANNPLAFGFLVPLFGLGMCGLWGARYGRFAPRTP